MLRHFVLEIPASCRFLRHMRRVSRKELGRLIGTCRRAAKAASTDSRDLPSSSVFSSTELWRDEILDQLEPVLDPWLANSSNDAVSGITATPQYRLVRRADDFFDSIPPSIRREPERYAKETLINSAFPEGKDARHFGRLQGFEN